MKGLSGKTVLVTGAASGIARATALAFARDGCRLVLVDIDEVGLRAVSHDVSTLGGEVSWYRADLREAPPGR